MFDYVYGHDEIVGNFVAALIPHCGGRGFGPAAKTIGVINADGVLVAGLVYTNYDPYAGVIEIAGGASLDPRWMTRETLKRMYQYPFITCGCQMVVQRVPAEDERQLRMLAAYGATFVKVARLFGRDRDAVISTLTVEDWAANKFNKRFRHHVDFDPALLEQAA